MDVSTVHSRCPLSQSNLKHSAVRATVTMLTLQIASTKLFYAIAQRMYNYQSITPKYYVNLIFNSNAYLTYL